MKLYVSTFILLITIIVCGCKHEVNFSDYPEISFANDINPVVLGNCTQSGCHGGAGKGSFSLEDYESVMKHGINAGNPAKSKFYKVIKSLNNRDRMPRSPYASLSDEQIKTIYLWIGQGAKNN